MSYGWGPGLVPACHPQQPQETSSERSSEFSLLGSLLEDKSQPLAAWTLPAVTAVSCALACPGLPRCTDFLLTV